MEYRMCWNSYLSRCRCSADTAAHHISLILALLVRIANDQLIDAYFDIVYQLSIDGNVDAGQRYFSQLHMRFNNNNYDVRENNW